MALRAHRQAEPASTTCTAPTPVGSGGRSSSRGQSLSLQKIALACSEEEVEDVRGPPSRGAPFLDPRTIMPPMWNWAGSTTEVTGSPPSCTEASGCSTRDRPGARSRGKLFQEVIIHHSNKVVGGGHLGPHPGPRLHHEVGVSSELAPKVELGGNATRVIARISKSAGRPAMNQGPRWHGGNRTRSWSLSEAASARSLSGHGSRTGKVTGRSKILPASSIVFGHGTGHEVEGDVIGTPSPAAAGAGAGT